MWPIISQRLHQFPVKRSLIGLLLLLTILFLLVDDKIVNINSRLYGPNNLFGGKFTVKYSSMVDYDDQKHQRLIPEIFIVKDDPTTPAPTPTPTIVAVTEQEQQESTTIREEEPTRKTLSECVPALKGAWDVDRRALDIVQIEQKYPEVSTGGHWSPRQCIARQRVAVLIPFRNRMPNLLGFLNNMHGLLQRQQLDYQIFVIDQAAPADGSVDRFNRAKLFNVGFTEASSKSKWDCFVFHDVDLVPENDQNLYICDEKNPKRLIFGREQEGYRRLYDGYFGAVTALTPAQFQSLNGFSNLFWGWGGEDDDLSHRLTQFGYRIVEVPATEGRYANLDIHLKPDDSTNPRINGNCMGLLLGGTKQRWRSDGLNSLPNNYRMVRIEQHPLYTNISVDLMMRDAIKRDDYPCQHLQF